jgi:hypothetical protein
MGLFGKKNKEVVKTFVDGRLVEEKGAAQPVPTTVADLLAEPKQQAQVEKPVKELIIEPVKVPGLPIVLLLKIDEAGNITLARV